MSDLYLCKKDNERFYCQPEQVDYWAEKGYAIYELAPKLVAGEEGKSSEEKQNVNVTIDETVTEAKDGGAE